MADTSPKERVASGIGIGLLFGAAVGIALDNLAIGIGVGMALGAAFGAQRGKRDDDGSDSE